MLSIHDSEIYKIAYSKENKDTFFKVTFFPFEGVSPNVEIKISIQYIFPICKKIRPRLLSIHDSKIYKITYSKKNKDTFFKVTFFPFEEVSMSKLKFPSNILFLYVKKFNHICYPSTILNYIKLLTQRKTKIHFLK